MNPSNGLISIFNKFGTTHVIVDVMGWYDQAGTTGSLYHGVTPTRIADTRPVNAPLQAGRRGRRHDDRSARRPDDRRHRHRDQRHGNRSGRRGFLTVYPSDLTEVPNVSNLNWPGPGTSTPNLALVRLPDER